MKNRSHHNAKAPPNANRARLESILQRVCDRLVVKRDDVVSTCRKTQVAEARRVYCWLARRCSGASFEEIGALVNTDHKLPLNASKAIDELRDRSPFILEVTDQLESQLKEAA